MFGLERRRLARLETDLRRASGEQLVAVERLVADLASIRCAEVALARRSERVEAERACPHCGTLGAHRHGRDQNGRPRFRCAAHACRRTFNVLTGTTLARARKPQLWGRYLGLMTSHHSVRAIAGLGLGIHPVTIWRWRHRFLQALAAESPPILSGVIEADETFFVRSFKGHRGWKRGRPPEQRAARPSAWGATQRGLSRQQVPVLTALDTGGGLIEVVLPSLGDIEAALAGRIAPGSVICSDGATVYVKLAATSGSEHRRVTVPLVAPAATKAALQPTRRRGKRRLGLGRVNAHHGRLKTFIDGRCRGVSARYLPAYLGWHRAMLRGTAGKSLLDRALA